MINISLASFYSVFYSIFSLFPFLQRLVVFLTDSLRPLLPLGRLIVHAALFYKPHQIIVNLERLLHQFIRGLEYSTNIHALRTGSIVFSHLQHGLISFIPSLVLLGEHLKRLPLLFSQRLPSVIDCSKDLMRGQKRESLTDELTEFYAEVDERGQGFYWWFDLGICLRLLNWHDHLRVHSWMQYCRAWQGWNKALPLWLLL